MDFNRHSHLEGRHAFLSASNYHWINYDEDKLARRFMTMQAAARGTRRHKLAQDLINEKVTLEDNNKTLNRYVNDCIRWRMSTEVLLFVSLNCFGTADAMSFDKNKLVLRISDLKTGEGEASVHQLEVYAAMFCIEYRYKPVDLRIELRIYQNDEVREYLADPIDITRIMSRMVRFDELVDDLREEVK